MITQCPFCGNGLSEPISNGISSCSNCWRVFDSSTYHRLLSASWVCRKHHVVYEDHLVYQYGFEKSEAEIVIKWVVDECFTHEEFRKMLIAEGYPEFTYSVSA